MAPSLRGSPTPHCSVELRKGTKPARTRQLHALPWEASASAELSLLAAVHPEQAEQHQSEQPEPRVGRHRATAAAFDLVGSRRGTRLPAVVSFGRFLVL